MYPNKILRTLEKLSNCFSCVNQEKIKDFIFLMFLYKNLPSEVKSSFFTAKIYNLDNLVQEFSILNNQFNVNFLRSLDCFRDLDQTQLKKLFDLIPILDISLYKFQYSEIIDYLFQNFLRHNSKSKTGVFYTPTNVADLIYQKTFDVYKSELSSNIKVCDPACGCGIFLRTIAKNYPDKDSYLEFIFNSIYGFDLDPLAIEVTNFLLIIESLERYPNLDISKLKKLKSNLFVGDSLLSFSDQKKSSNNQTFIDSNSFDIILANPPFGLSRGEQISKEQLDSYSQNFSKVIFGKINKYQLFIFLCLELVKPNGIVGILTPNSWLGISNAKKLRDYIIHNTSLFKIIKSDKSFFPKLGVETDINIFQKKSDSINSLKEICVEKLCKDNSIKIDIISIQTIKKSSELIIPIGWNEKYGDIIDKIEANSFKLKSKESFLKPSIALQVYQQGKGNPPQNDRIVKNHIFHKLTKIDENHYPYLEGQDVNSNSINWSGKFLNYGPWIAEYQDISKFSSPRILIREVLGKYPYIIKASYTDQTFLYNRSILHILPTESIDPELLLAVSHILNSKLATFLFKIFGRKTQRKLFPKLLKADLDDFLIPKTIFVDYKKLVTLEKDSDITSFRNTIDSLVYGLYNLNKQDIEIIENGLR